MENDISSQLGCKTCNLLNAVSEFLVIYTGMMRKYNKNIIKIYIIKNIIKNQEFLNKWLNLSTNDRRTRTFPRVQMFGELGHEESPLNSLELFGSAMNLAFFSESLSNE